MLALSHYFAKTGLSIGLEARLEWCFVAIAVFFGLLAVNVFSYHQMQKEQDVATLSFEKSARQTYDVTVSQPGGAEMRYEVRGDLWANRCSYDQVERISCGFWVLPLVISWIVCKDVILH